MPLSLNKRAAIDSHALSAIQYPSMKNTQPIPAPVVGRLSLYLRQVEQLARQGRTKVSSRELAESLQITDAKVRKDLAWFGNFGSPGVGYRIEPLIEALRHVMGTDRTWDVVVVGVGDLGRALLRYRGFRRKGFRVLGAFDVAPTKVGKKIGEVPVWHFDQLPEIIRQHKVKLAVVAVPAEAAQGVVDKLCRCGIKGILNFAATSLQTSAGVAVSQVDLAASLEQLSFQMVRK